MATKLNAKTIGTYIRDRIKANVGTELGLVACNLGDLRRVFWPASEDAAGYGSRVPAVFVMPVDFDNKLGTLNQRYDQNLRFRVVYVRAYDEGVTAFDALENGLARIADQILENYRFDNPAIALSQAQMVIAEVSSGEFDPPENELFMEAGAQLHAAAIIVTVRLRMWNTV